MKKLLLILAMAIWAAPVHAQGTCGCTTIVEVKPAGIVEVPYQGCDGDVEIDGKSLRVPIGRPVVVRVTDTNTAFISHTVESKSVPSVESEQINKFLKAARSYFSAIGGNRSGTGVPEGMQGFWITRLHVLNALQKMAAPRADVAVIREALISTLSGRLEDAPAVEVCPAVADCPSRRYRLKMTSETIAELQRIANISQPSDDEKAILEGANDFLSAVYALDDLTYAATSACSTWQSAPFKVTAQKAKEVKITPAAAEHPDLKRLARSIPAPIDLTVQPNWRIRPAVGLALAYSRDSQFPEFGTVQRGEKFLVAQTGSVDQRLEYGLTLGLTYPMLDRRASGSGLTVWLPEVMINPQDNVRSFGASGAISWRFLKLGAGVMWTKHSLLSGGQSVGQTLDFADELKKRSTYGDPKFMLTFSLIGWQPFIAE